MSVILLGCSTITLPRDRQSVEEYASLYRLSRKSRMTSVAIPEKGLLASSKQNLAISAVEIDAESVSTLFRNPLTRDAVIDFFVSVTGSEEVALTSLYYSDRFEVNPFLTFSLMYNESRFLPKARNENPGSIDRGLFQLNSKTFPNLADDDFFNIDTNARHGLVHLKWCLDRAKGNTDTALAFYNAGESRVLAGRTPPSTIAYVKKINEYRGRLTKNFLSFMRQRLEREMAAKEV